MKWLALTVLAVGCAAPALPPPTDTGARDATKRYFEALVAKDWGGAHALLAADSRRRVSQDQFARLAQAHRKSLGLEPDSVFVTSCDEHGAEATARVTLAGKGSGRHRYKEGITLRRESDGWRVVLPANFGRAGK